MIALGETRNSLKLAKDSLRVGVISLQATGIRYSANFKQYGKAGIALYIDVGDRNRNKETFSIN